MSGPKCSQFRLNEIARQKQREILWRKLDEERKKVLCDELKKVEHSCQELRNEIIDRVDKAIESVKTIPDAADDVRIGRQGKQKLLDRIDIALSRVKTRNPEQFSDLEQHLGDLKTAIGEIVKERDTLDTTIDRMNAYAHVSKVEVEEKALFKFIEQTSKLKQQRTNMRITNESARWVELRIDYLSLCKILEIEPDVWFQKESHDLHLFENEIERLRALLEQRNESEFIANEVHDVMTRLGYDVLETQLLRTPNQRHLIHDMFSFDRDAIQVFTGDDGSILFEVTGLSETKREPTDLDKQRVVEHMEAFCSQYDLIKEHLATRGIFLAQENLLPAEASYVRMVQRPKKETTQRGVQNLRTMWAPKSP